MTDTASPDDERCNLIRQDWEDPHYEFKGPMAWNESDPSAIGLIKDVLALANSGGGSLVIGVAEVDGGIEFRGLTTEHLRTWDPTTFSDQVNRFADPPITCTVRKLLCGGQSFVLVSIPGFTSTPHFCKRDHQESGLRQQTVYVRTPNSASAPVNNATTFMTLVNQAVLARHDELARLIRSAIVGPSEPTSVDDAVLFRTQADRTLAELADPYAGRYPGYIIQVMHPARFDQNRFPLEKLQHAIQSSVTPQYFYGSFLYRIRGESIALNDGFSLDHAWSNGKEEFYIYWRLFESGLLLRKELMDEDSASFTEYKILSLDYFIQRVFVGLDALVRIYSLLEVVDEDVTWKLSLSGSKGRILHQSNMMLAGKSYSSRESEVIYSRTRSIEDWRANLDDHVVEATQRILRVFQYNADLSHRIRTVIERYRRGQP